MPRGLIRLPLRAAAGLYGLAVRARRRAYGLGLLPSGRPPVPVISVGNISIGGSGKTPCVASIVELLRAEGLRPAVVSRGYRGLKKGISVVSDGSRLLLEPPQAADEAAMLARKLPGVPVLTGTRRVEVVRAAVEDFGAQVVVLDDGFQHLACRRDLDIVLVDSTKPPSQDGLLPLGRLREPPSALSRAHLVVATKSSGPEDMVAVGQWVWGRVPVVRAKHVPVGWRNFSSGESLPLEERPKERAVAFCALADPGSFRRTLGEMGVGLAGFASYRDHHLYRSSDRAFLTTWAERLGAGWFVTTEKDAARLGPLKDLSLPLYVLEIEFRIVEGEDIWRKAILSAASADRPF